MHNFKESRMKKNLLAVAVLTASAFIPSAFAADGALNITGTITDQSCTVDPDSQNKQCQSLQPGAEKLPGYRHRRYRAF